MRYPFLIPLVICGICGTCLVALLLWRSRTLKTRDRVWIANSGYVRELPRYKQLLRRQRAVVASIVAVFVALTITLGITAGAPINKKTEPVRNATRDIALCLDFSGSMIEYDQKILSQFAQIVDYFRGERISLHLWSGRSTVVFPLTDDNEMAIDELKEISAIISKDWRVLDENNVSVGDDLLRLLNATIDTTQKNPASSLVGDGLAECVTNFDHTDEERSRLVVFATDNEVEGEQLFTLPEATDLAIKNKVKVISLYPEKNPTLNSDKSELDELRTQAERTGGDAYAAAGKSSISAIVDRIKKEEKVGEILDERTTITDTPVVPLVFLLIFFTALCSFAAWIRM